MGRNAAIVILVLALAIGGVGALFAVQNSARVTQLSLDLGVAAWQLEQPVSIPALIAICFGAGLLVGALPFALRAGRLAGKVRQLEQQVAVNASIPGTRDPGAW